MGTDVSKLEKGLEKVKIAALQEKIKDLNVECMMLLRYIEDMKKVVKEHTPDILYNYIIEEVAENVTKSTLQKSEVSLLDVRKYLEDHLDRMTKLSDELQSESYYLDQAILSRNLPLEEFQEMIRKPEPMNFKAKTYEKRMEQVQEELEKRTETPEVEKE